MKVLIVDDNVAVQDVIRDIVEAEGCLTRVASTLDEAVEKTAGFLPDIIFLDMSIDDADGLSLIPRIKEANPSMAVNVVLLTTSSDHVPTDMPEIKGNISKPFKTSAVVDALYNVTSAPTSAKTEAPKKKKKRFSLFGRNKDKIPAPVASPSQSGVSFGTSYVVFETWPEKIYEFVGLFNTDDYSVMVVTSDKLKAVKERFDYGKIDVRTMSASPKNGMFDIRGLGTVVTSVRDFINNSHNPVVVFDNFDEIVKVNGMNNALKMFHLLMSSTEGVIRTVAMSVNEGELSEKDRRILLHEMKQFVPKV